MKLFFREREQNSVVTEANTFRLFLEKNNGTTLAVKLEGSTGVLSIDEVKELNKDLGLEIFSNKCKT